MTDHGPDAGLLRTIGDDAAVLAAGRDQLVISVDAQVEGTHFRPQWLSWADLGFRATMAAASDLAAMAAHPRALLASLTLPPDFSDADLEQLASGQADAAELLGAPLVGGNLARGASLAVHTTAVGACHRFVGRDGARAGDVVCVAGALGTARAGLRLLQERYGDDSRTAVREALAAWRRPQARIAEGVAVSSWAHAAIDVSDGLAGDARHLAEASGVEIVLDAGTLMALPEVARVLDPLAALLDESSIELITRGGEDYALLVTGPAPAPVGFAVIGRCEAGAPSVWLERGGERRALGGGHDHFGPESSS